MELWCVLGAENENWGRFRRPERVYKLKNDATLKLNEANNGKIYLASIILNKADTTP